MLHEELKQEIMRQLAEYEEQNIGLAAAEQIAGAAKAKAEQMGICVSIAVVDAGANPVLQLRMDNALLVSIETAYRKAYTAAALGQSTAELKDRASSQGALYGLHALSGGKYCVFGGGLPVFCGTRLLGAVGVSGGTAEEDAEICTAAVQACPKYRCSKKQI